MIQAMISIAKEQSIHISEFGMEVDPQAKHEPTFSESLRSRNLQEDALFASPTLKDYNDHICHEYELNHSNTENENSILFNVLQRDRPIRYNHTVVPAKEDSIHSSEYSYEIDGLVAFNDVNTPLFEQNDGEDENYNDFKPKASCEPSNSEVIHSQTFHDNELFVSPSLKEFVDHVSRAYDRNLSNIENENYIIDRAHQPTLSSPQRSVNPVYHFSEVATTERLPVNSSRAKRLYIKSDVDEEEPQSKLLKFIQCSDE